MKIKDKVIELGGTGCIPGPNAMYATGFPSKEKAEDFINWVRKTSTYVEQLGRPVEMKNNTFDVRYNVS